MLYEANDKGSFTYVINETYNNQNYECYLSNAIYIKMSSLSTDIQHKINRMMKTID